MAEKKIKKDQEKNQDVLELIEDSLGGVSGGIKYKSQNVDNYDHWHMKNKFLNHKKRK